MSLTKVEDRLQPALLDRLRDDEPTHRKETAEKGVLNRNRLREAVLRDLAWLFNCAQLGSSVSLEGMPYVQRSVLNYGLPVLAGQTISSVDLEDLANQVRQAILDHEPRVLANSLKVEVLSSEQSIDHHNQVGFRISGHLWAQPVPLELLLHTDIDLETGRVDLRDAPR
jgi:type VI secretion system protein ImpF